MDAPPIFSPRRARINDPAPVSRRQLGSTERWDQIVEVAEVLTKAGGAVIAIYEGHDIVMSDPEGNELCIL